ncbi:MAG: gamma-glutamyl-gamma-aminobutyrate hydrolase family protein [Bacteroidales bacterium]|nr:gamma-glutamyl-gamma-aminobutyrate hydrolase family protein [Bacteroidales bacterium]
MKRLSVILLIVFTMCGCSAPRQAHGSRAPLIGISAAGGDVSRVDKAYIEAVCAAGGVPVIIPIITDSLALVTILDKVDGVVMTGGEDIDPGFYGECPLPGIGTINARRDTFDLMLARMTARSRKPILGICRGIQVINVAFGGSLWQDIPSQIPQSPVQHRSKNDENPFHNVYIKEGSRLAALTQTGSTRINTFHHQAVKDVAEGFMVTAMAPDSVVEAIECFEMGYRIIGIQFHPEKMYATGDLRFQPLFEWLVKESRK